MMKNFLDKRVAFLAAGVMAVGLVSEVSAPAAEAAVHYGAIAYSSNGANGRAWDYPSRSSAEAAAINSCGYTDCSVLTSFTGCGAVAYNGRLYYGGSGPTLSAAQNRALSNLGGGWIDTWVCN